MKLSVVIASVNDPDLPNTVASLLSVSKTPPEIIVVDDCSVMARQPLPNDCRVIRCSKRIGVGPARTLGVECANGDAVAICDAHMRFEPHWDEQALLRIENQPQSLYCTTCCGFTSNKRKPHAGTYYGARIALCERDGPEAHIWEARWNTIEPQDDEEIGAVMGACYIMRRAWFEHLQPLRYLRCWGSDEMQLSVKTWLAGGTVRLLKRVRVHHKFHSPKDRATFQCRVGQPTFNKLLGIHTMTPPELASKLDAAVRVSVPEGEYIEAHRLMAEDPHITILERAWNQNRFTRPFEWLIERFGLSCP